MIINWNKTGKIKTMILIVSAILLLIRPINSKDEFRFSAKYLAAFIAVIVFTVISFKINSKQTDDVNLLSWNENPFTSKKPFVKEDFFSYLCIVTGFSMLLGTAITYHKINTIAPNLIIFGAGQFTGQLIAKKIFRAKN